MHQAMLLTCALFCGRRASRCSPVEGREPCILPTGTDDAPHSVVSGRHPRRRAGARHPPFERDARLRLPVRERDGGPGRSRSRGCAAACREGARHVALRALRPRRPVRRLPRPHRRGRDALETLPAGVGGGVLHGRRGVPDRDRRARPRIRRLRGSVHAGSGRRRERGAVAESEPGEPARSAPNAPRVVRLPGETASPASSSPSDAPAPPLSSTWSRHKRTTSVSRPGRAPGPGYRAP